MSEKNTHQCLNCTRPETEIPLVSLRFAGSEAWICSQCLPTLIHQPEKLAGKLTGADKFGPAPGHHH